MKPGNFLIHKDSKDKIFLHLSDFGVAKNYKDELRDPTTFERIKGTLEYLAPEILNGQSNVANARKQDVWAIGVIAYQLCSFTLPFKGGNESQTLALILDPK